MSKFNEQAIRARITEVAHRDMGLPDGVAEDVAFHMTDWLDDLEAYARFCADPGSMSDEAVGEMLTGFLVHVPNHLAAAGKLYTGIPVTDVFGVDATGQNSNGPR